MTESRTSVARPQQGPTVPRKSVRITETIAVVLLAALVAPFAFQAAPATIGHEAAFVVVSGSMSGTLEAGDLLFIKAVDPAELKVGDVIAYRDVQGQVVTHRIVGIQGDDIVTKGDANDAPDPLPVHPDQVLGRYSFRVPYYGQAANVVGTGLLPLVLVYAICIPLLVREARSLMGPGTDGDVKERKPARRVDARLPGLALLVCMGLALTASELEPASAAFHDEASVGATWAACIVPKGLELETPGNRPGIPPAICGIGNGPPHGVLGTTPLTD